MGKKSRLTGTAKLIIIVGVFTIVLSGIFSIPNFVNIDRPDIGLITDQLSLSDDFVQFRIAGGVRTTIAGGGSTIDTSNTIDALTGSQITNLLQGLPDSCGLKLQTTVVFGDGTRKLLGSGAGFREPIPLASLVTGQGQVIKQFEVVPLMRCGEVIAKDGSRHGYEHEWLNGVNLQWDAYKIDGTLFVEGNQKGVNTPSKQSDVIASILAGTLLSARPTCGAVTFGDIGDLKATGLYSNSQIQRWKDTFGSADGGIFIGSERAVCAKDVNGVVADPFIVTADEIEQRIVSAGKQFDTTLIITPTSGTTLLEIPYLTEQLGKPFVTIHGFDQTVAKQFFSFSVDNLSTQIDPIDITPPPTGVTRTAPKTVSFDPVKIDIADLKDSERTVTWRISLNSYSESEGIPNIVVSPYDNGSGFCGLCIGEIFDSIIGGTTDGRTATIPMKDAGVSGDKRLFEGMWVVQEGQSLGTYEMKVTMNRGSVAKLVEVIQKAEDAPSETPEDGKCGSGKQIVEGSDGTDICVAECAGDLKYDLIQKACAIQGTCTGDLVVITKEDGSKACGKAPITPTNGGDLCSDGLKFNPNTNRCETESIPPVKCKDGETLVNSGTGTSCIPEIPDFIKLLTPIACVGKIGFTDAGFCLPPLIVGLFQNPLQIIYIAIGLMVVIIAVKLLLNAVTRQRGGLLLSQ